jgi:GGDEF domain-containing protein
MSKIVNAEIERIVPNPFRMLEKYPYSEEKLVALQSSIEATGFWEGVIARSSGDEFQLAFGHHRVEAARRLGLQSIPLVIHDLTDEQMLQMMGRENMEDYHTSFLVLLNTWEAADKFISATADIPTQTIKIAHLLGWVTIRGEGKQQGEEILNNTARATSAALNLIKNGYNSHSDFEGLTVYAARQIVEKAQNRIKEIDRAAKSQNHPEKLVQEAKQHVGTAVKETTRQAREGKIAQRDLRAAVEINIFGAHNEAKRQTPLFSPFGTSLANSIDQMLATDASSEKLRHVRDSVKHLILEEDKQTLSRVFISIGLLIERAEKWRGQLSARQEKVVSAKVVPVKAITKTASEG